MALEVDRVAPPSGNLWLGGQQIWLGPRLAGRLVRFWVDETRVRVLLDGARLKTLPSRLSDDRPLVRTADLRRLPGRPRQRSDLDLLPLTRGRRVTTW